MWQKCVRFLWLATFILAGCVSGTTVLPANTTTVEKPTEAPNEVLRPLISRWIIGTKLEASEPSFSFAIHLLEITPHHTTVIYSTSYPSADQFEVEKSIRMVDQKGQEYPLLKVTPLNQFDNLKVEALTFVVRQRDATELHLLVQPPGGEGLTLDFLAAMVYGSLEEFDYLYGSGYWWVSREGYVTQNQYKISFNGFWLGKGDLIAEERADPGLTDEEAMRGEMHLTETPPSMAEAPTEISSPRILSPPYPPMITGTPPWLLEPTPTQVPPNAIAAELAGGKRIMREATLRFEDTQSGQVDYLYILFLEDGKVKSTVLQ
jgi:hypothetical protein